MARERALKKHNRETLGQRMWDVQNRKNRQWCSERGRQIVFHPGEKMYASHMWLPLFSHLYVTPNDSVSVHDGSSSGHNYNPALPSQHRDGKLVCLVMRITRCLLASLYKQISHPDFYITNACDTVPLTKPWALFSELIEAGHHFIM